MPEFERITRLPPCVPDVMTDPDTAAPGIEPTFRNDGRDAAARPC